MDWQADDLYGWPLEDKKVSRIEIICKIKKEQMFIKHKSINSKQKNLKNEKRKYFTFPSQEAS